MNKFCMALLLWLTISSVYAVDVYQLADPEQQKTYETLTAELRCLVCQNQNIADSHAELAGDLRRQVYEMLQQGKSKDDIVQFMTDRYGDFVLYNPPLKAKTGLLWLGPLGLLLAGLTMIALILRRKKNAVKIELDGSERQKIKQLLAEENKD
jgi:cytochrome c-type biogenesis protein CcmH